MNSVDVGARATESVGLLVEAVDQIPSAAWDQPSNLEGWSIRDLVAHTTGTTAKIVTLVEGGKVVPGPADPDDWRSDNPAAQIRELAGRLHDALASADPNALQPESVPEETLRRPGGFGPAQPVPDDATPTARLMAYFGRPVG